MTSLALVAAMVKSVPGCWTMILPAITEPFFKTTVVFCSALLEYKKSKANIAITFPGDTKTVSKKTGLNLGLGFTSKFIFGSINSLVPRDTILGFGVGAKVMAYAPDIILSTRMPILAPYLDLFVEQRFFVSRKLALVGGINVGVDMMMFQSTDVGQLFNGMYITAFPSLNVGLSIGLHFGH